MNLMKIILKFKNIKDLIITGERVYLNKFILNSFNVTLIDKLFTSYIYDLDKVKLFIGDSSYVLDLVIPNKQCIFLLQSNYFGHFPLMEELRQISQHKKKNHVIIIGSINEKVWNSVGVTLQDVEKLILEINSRYEITYQKGMFNSFLIAQVKKRKPKEKLPKRKPKEKLPKRKPKEKKDKKGFTE